MGNKKSKVGIYIRGKGWLKVTYTGPYKHNNPHREECEEHTDIQVKPYLYDPEDPYLQHMLQLGGPAAEIRTP